MYWIEISRVALKPFRTRSLESLLIVVGVGLGVGVTTTMLTLILYGTTLIEVFKNVLYVREVRVSVTATDSDAFYNGSSVNPVIRVGRVGDPSVTLQRSDLGTIKRAVIGVQYAYLIDFTSIAWSTMKGKPGSDVTLRAVTDDFIRAADLELLSGAWPSKTEFDRGSRVLVLTEGFARVHFGNVNPVGTALDTANGGRYKVIGVFRPPENSIDFVTKRNSAPYLGQGLVPWGIQDSNSLQVRELRFLAKPEDAVTILEGMRAYTAQRWAGRVSVSNSSAQFKESVTTATAAAFVLTLFSSGGLLIAAINIMNLMLARVIGRTRDIGVARALGANRRQIFTQFLIEALILGLVGGLLGLLCAWGLTAALDNLLNSNPMQASGLHLRLEPLNLLIGLLIGLGVSVLFGLYPALIAARVRPAEALRA